MSDLIRRIQVNASRFLLNICRFYHLIREIGLRSNSLSDAAKELNLSKSVLRMCVDYIYGCILLLMDGKMTMKIGLAGDEARWASITSS